MDSATLEALGITKEEIIDRLVGDASEGLSEVVRQEVRKIVSDTAPKLIEEKLAKSIDDILDAAFVPVDEFGEPQRYGKAKTLREMVKEKAVNYLAVQVGSDGKETRYNAIGTRGDYIATKVVEKAIDYETKKEVEKAVTAAKAQLKSQIAQHIVTTLLNSK